MVGTGIHGGLKIRCSKEHEGSNPSPGTVFMSRTKPLKPIDCEPIYLKYSKDYVALWHFCPPLTQQTSVIRLKKEEAFKLKDNSTILCSWCGLTLPAVELKKQIVYDFFNKKEKK
jgi:hypothetical protein